MKINPMFKRFLNILLMPVNFLILIIILIICPITSPFVYCARYIIYGYKWGHPHTMDYPNWYGWWAYKCITALEFLILEFKVD